MTMPSEVDEHVGAFDRFAEGVSRFVSRAVFFAGCVALVAVWAPSYFLFGSVDTWQLVINTATTIVTFLMVALLQNSQTRADAAVQHKLNAVADGLIALLYHAAIRAIEDNDPREAERLMLVIRELNAGIGVEQRETSD